MEGISIHSSFRGEYIATFFKILWEVYLYTCMRSISMHLSFRGEYITGCHLMEVGGKLIVGFAAFEARGWAHYFLRDCTKGGESQREHSSNQLLEEVGNDH
jgi:hypothetical protein